MPPPRTERISSMLGIDKFKALPTRRAKTKIKNTLCDGTTAEFRGWLVAYHVFGRKMTYRGSVGTVICQVFGLNVCLVGLSVKSLWAQGLAPEYVTVHPLNHADYHPGSSPMTLKLAFSKSDG
jgi:hypothetical protein